MILGRGTSAISAISVQRMSGLQRLAWWSTVARAVVENLAAAVTLFMVFLVVIVVVLSSVVSSVATK